MQHEPYTKHCMYSISFNCLVANEKFFYYPPFRIKETENSQGWSNWYKVPSDGLCCWTQIQFCLTTNCMLLIIVPVLRAALGWPQAPGIGPGEKKITAFPKGNLQEPTSGHVYHVRQCHLLFSGQSQQ